MTDPNAPSLRHQLALAAAVAGGITLLAGIVAGLGVDERWPIDKRVRTLLAGKRHPRIRASLEVAGRAGTFGMYAPAGIILATLMHHRHDSKRALPVIVTIGGVAFAVTVLKHTVRRPRPRRAVGKAKERHSFPSGHASRATATSLLGAYLLVRERMVPAELVMPLAAAIALSTGVSRTYADAHWSTDVIGGWALGAAAAAGGAIWYEQLRAEAHDDD